MIQTTLCCAMALSIFSVKVALYGADLSTPLSLHWRKSTPLPEPRAGYAAGIVHGKLVIAGGTYWEGKKGYWKKKLFTASTHAFDPIAQKWEKLPDAPFPFGYAASVTVSDRLYVMGGHTGQQANRKILVLEKTGNGYAWSFHGNLPDTRLFAGAVSLGSSIYILGGTLEFEPYDAVGTCCTSKTAINNLMVLDTAKPSLGWRELTGFPGDKRWSFSRVVDDKSIWMFGGKYQETAKDSVRRFDEVLRYQISTGTWEHMAPLPKALRDATPLTPVLVGGKIIFMSFAKKVWQFDLATMKYSELSPLTEEAFVDKFFWLNNQVIGAGGENKIEGPRRRSEWTFVADVK